MSKISKEEEFDEICLYISVRIVCDILQLGTTR